MRPIRETIPLAEALALLLEGLAPVTAVEQVSLADAAGRVLARPVTASADVPPFDRAAMDGYAVVAEDTFGATRSDPRVLRHAGAVFTGEVPSRAVARGECIEIATGAPMPDGADAVVMVEETERSDDGGLRIFTPVYPRQNVGRRGADIIAGQVILRPGDLLNPSRVGALAATGTAAVSVFARPGVAVISTGNEIVDPGQPLGAGQIYDINRFTLSAVIREHGGTPLPIRTAGDSLEELTSALASAKDADIIVFSGGSSVGERDLVIDLMKRAGEVVFHGIAVKPGKPTFGMPGYPTSCLTNAYVLLVPVLRVLARLPAQSIRVERMPLAARISSTANRHQFYTVRVQDGRAVPAFKASGDITSMSQADGYIEIDAGTIAVEAGTIVDVKFF
jgi:molybdenum cofactor synthesis domain-containing protein